MSQPNMADMFGKLNEMQEKMKEAQSELENITVEAEAGGGMVKVQANGKRQVLGVKLDEEVIDPDDSEMLEDLIVAGVNKALDKAEEAGKEKMQDAYKGMIPGGGIPGFDMSKLGL